MQTIEETLWKVVDGHWCNVSRSLSFVGLNIGATSKPLDVVECCLADYLWEFGFEIPSTISYCLANNTKFSLKLRNNGGSIHCFVKFP